jgi:hypothetical protein
MGFLSQRVALSLIKLCQLHTRSNVMMTVNDERERSGRKQSHPVVRFYPSICYDELKKTMNSARTAKNWTEIQTLDLPCTKEWAFCST